MSNSTPKNTGDGNTIENITTPLSYWQDLHTRSAQELALLTEEMAELERMRWVKTAEVSAAASRFATASGVLARLKAPQAEPEPLSHGLRVAPIQPAAQPLTHELSVATTDGSTPGLRVATDTPSVAPDPLPETPAAEVPGIQVPPGSDGGGRSKKGKVSQPDPPPTDTPSVAPEGEFVPGICLACMGQPVRSQPDGPIEPCQVCGCINDEEPEPVPEPEPEPAVTIAAKEEPAPPGVDTSHLLPDLQKEGAKLMVQLGWDLKDVSHSKQQLGEILDRAVDKIRDLTVDDWGVVITRLRIMRELAASGKESSLN